MSDLEEIQAAIKKLTDLRSVGVMYPDQYPGDTDAAFKAACGLITTLHRTINAQLDILRFAATLHPLKDKTRTEWATIHNAETLARAINGGAE